MPAPVEKPEGEVWVAYAGNISALYDLETLVEAVAIAAKAHPELRAQDSWAMAPNAHPSRRPLMRTGAPAELLGYMPYRAMAAWLKASDMVVNSLVANAPQSVPTKIGDYLASGRPMVNTSMNVEFREKVEREGFGVNVVPGDAEGLARVICELVEDEAGRARMGRVARELAAAQFDRPHSYEATVDLIRSLIAERSK